MVDLTQEERAAMRAAVKPVALIMEKIGWETPLHALTEAHVVALIEESVAAFQEEMGRIAKTKASECKASDECPF